MALLTGKTLALALVLALPAAFAVGRVGHPSPDIRMTSNTTAMPAAAIAADCAGFPMPVVLEMGKSYHRARIFTIDRLPERYEAKVVVVHQAGGCQVETAPRPPPEEAKKRITLAPALGLRDHGDMQGEGLPVYVIAEFKAPQGSTDRVFVAFRFPAPVQTKTTREPVRIT